MNDPSIVESVFLAALGQATDEARTAYLDDACKDDPGLREQVNRLLAAHPKAVKFMGQPAAPMPENTAAYVPRSQQVATVVAGRYKLLEIIGEGGMGEVWVADQLEPIRRRVALKLIKPGMDSRSVLARFEAERQALALMDHPNIAKVLDAGTTADGRPYFVMELVKGTPITDFCDARKLCARERLQLFVPVCQAIQHAHTKGVIHRDIKPSNVLVALHDEQPVPKVIDFGVAKAVGQQLTEKTIYTGFGGLAGTPAYMAPEQATFNQLDIDTRADVYALGVLLYELLAGSPPVEPERMKKAALDEVLRVVREEEPPRPSQRFSTSHSRASIAAVRQTDPVKLSKLIQGELDWIVMKALDKDRTRRYETANGFATDVQRYLAGEPVQAVPPSAAYRLRKFARKNRAMLTSAIAFAGLLITAVVVSSWLAVLAKRAEATAEVRQKEAEASSKEATANAERAKAGELAVTRAQFETIKEKAKIDTLAQGLQIDLDLIEMRENPRIGLLRLARPPKHNDDAFSMKYRFADEETYRELKPTHVATATPEFHALREFVTAAVLAYGQEFAPLLPPITHDGHRILSHSLSSDRQRLLTLGTDGTARLWDIKTARQITVLRHRNEQIVNCGFSPDGKTVFTDDSASVARFWDVPSGTFRAATTARPNRYDLPNSLLCAEKGSIPFAAMDASVVSANRLLTRRFFAEREGEHSNNAWKAPIELWDTATGRLVARLDTAGQDAESFRIHGDGRWVTACDSKSTIAVFAVEDGRLVGHLTHPEGGTVFHTAASPSGRFLATLTKDEHGKTRLRIWDTVTWRAGSPHTLDLWFACKSARFLRDDLIGITEVESKGFGFHMFERVYRLGSPESWFDLNSEVCVPLLPFGNLMLTDEGNVFETKSGLRLTPPQGRKFHPSLSKFAADGRFVAAGRQIVDTLSDKSFPAWECGHLPGFGYISAVQNGDSAEFRLLPTAFLERIPPDLLELWLKVAMRGELDAENRFTRWDEVTWEKHRQELAAKPVASADIPFPGYVATDKYHWLRAEFNSANEKDKPRLANQIVQRAEAAGDKVEATRWRGALAAIAEKKPTSVSK